MTQKKKPIIERLEFVQDDLADIVDVLYEADFPNDSIIKALEIIIETTNKLKQIKETL